MSNSKVMDNQRLMYRKIVIEHIKKSGGYFVVCCKDDSFIAMLKKVLKELGFPSENLLSVVQNELEILKAIMAACTRPRKVIVIVEAEDETVYRQFLSQLKVAYPGFSTIVLLSLKQKAQAQEFQYYDSVIVRPLSPETLLEKIAFSVRPQPNFGKLVEAGKNFIQHRKYDNAIQIAQAILEKKPGSMAGLLLLGDIYKEQKLYRNAESNYMLAHNNVPLALEPLIALVKVAKEQEDNAKFSAYMKKLASIAPENEMKFIESTGFAVNLDALQSSDERKKELGKSLNELGSVILKMLPYLQAENPDFGFPLVYSFMTAKEQFIERDDGPLFERMGIYYKEIKRPKEAIKAFMRCLNLLPKRAESHYQLAVVYYEEGYIKEAYAMIKRLLSINPRYGFNSYLTAYHIGLIFERVNDTNNAKNWLRLAAELEKKEQQQGIIKQ